MEDNYTRETHTQLNHRFQMKKDGVYYAHQPIYGYRTPYADGSNIARYMVTHSIVNALGSYRFGNFIDIGGAEGYTAHVVKTLFGVNVASTDLSEKACEMAGKLFGIEALPCDIHHLPFADGAFDAVLCSETIEHVTDYKQAIDELLRITANVLVITVPHETPEIVAANIRNKVPHGHIHYFNTQTLDYLNDRGYKVSFKKTLSPLLTIPRVLAEGCMKHKSQWYYRLYNRFTGILRKLTGIRTAHFLVDLDARLAQTLGAYCGITFTIEKSDAPQTPHPKRFRAADFTSITVNEFLLEITSPAMIHHINTTSRQTLTN